MKLSLKFIFVLVVLLFAGSFVQAEDGQKSESYSIWFGGHYSDFTDYTKKVGEYDKGENETLPEFALKYLSTGSNSILRFVGHYYDDKNIYAKLNSTVSDKLKLSMQYRTLIKQEGQDLLTNLEAREYLPASGKMSGKMLTHDIQDPDADYNTTRRELLTKFSLLLSEKNDVRLNATHRMILKSGTEQKISSTHCFSCHMTSMTGQIDNTQHQIEAGIDAKVNDFDLGYQFGYRVFEPSNGNTLARYDDARHPVNGSAGTEFGSRLIYEDVTAEFAVLPKTEKTSHKVKFKRNVGQGYLSGALGYTSAENKYTSLESNSYSSALNYAAILNPTTRLITKVAISKYDSDSIYIDLPTFRAYASNDSLYSIAYDSNTVDFDFTRYSALNRTNTKLSAEIIKRMNKNMTFNLLAGYDIVNRDNYPTYDDGISTKKLYLQGKMRYRKGLSLRSSLKLRFEKITDPFVSGRGLFEAAGEEILDPLTDSSKWIFYFQREALRYQDITSLPTQVFSFDWNMSYNPNMQTSIMLGVKGKLDKNNDLDSLDVEHTSFVPSMALQYTPTTKFSMHTGYSYNFDKSKLPVAVALFDG